jgi:hypothetical protein
MRNEELGIRNAAHHAGSNSEFGMLITGVSLGKQQEGGAEIRNPKLTRGGGAI